MRDRPRTRTSDENARILTSGQAHCHPTSKNVASPQRGPGCLRAGQPITAHPPATAGPARGGPEPRRRVSPQDEAVTIHHSARYQVKAPEAGTVKAAIAAFAEYVANEPGSKMPTAWQQKTTRQSRPPLRVHRPVRAAGTRHPGRRTKIRNRLRVERRTLRSVAAVWHCPAEAACAITIPLCACSLAPEMRDDMQHSGTAGRTENCQVGTFLAYASVHACAEPD